MKNTATRFREFSIGMRTVKTALAVLICMIFYYIAEQVEIANGFDAFLACTAAVIGMQDSMKNSFRIGLGRLEGTALGAGLGMGVLYLEQWLKDALPREPFVILHILIVVLGTILIIIICNLFNRNPAIIMGCVVFYVVALQAGIGDPLISSVQRFVDTAVGIAIAIAINHLIHNPDKRGERGDDEADEEGDRN